jgi:hypothetical protein
MRSNKSPKFRVSIPKEESRMIRLVEEKYKSVLPSPKQVQDSLRQYGVGISDVELLGEVLDTIDHGENSTQGSTRDVFDRWILSFHDQEHVFSSPILVCELKYSELLQVQYNVASSNSNK